MRESDLYRLADSTAAEPLVNKWAAWSHLIAPVSGSLHLRNYQIKLMESYLRSPRAHLEAYQDRRLRSGRFINVKEERAQEIESLLETTKSNLGENITLAEELTDFHNYLVEEAVGKSLEPFYRKTPRSLRGYVELIYDYYHRPSIRFFESLLYKSQYYRKDIQSFCLFKQIKDDSRSFIMNTPRLSQPEQIDWRIPFESSYVDDLFRLDVVPQPFGYVRELLGLNTTSDKLLFQMLSAERVQTQERWNDRTIRIRYFGHACVLIEWNGINLLSDPNIGVLPSTEGIDRFTYKDLPEKIDYLLITHNHHDHFCLETLLRLRHRIGQLIVPRASGVFYGDISLKLMAQTLGFKNVIEVDSLERIDIPSGAIIPVPFLGEHADLPHGKTAYVIQIGDERILLAADSDCLDDQIYAHIRRIIGPIQSVFLGMECVGAPLSWSCGSFFPVEIKPEYENSRRYKGCDSRRALAILDAIGAERIYIYAMGLEPWLEHLLGLALTKDSVQLKEAKELLRKTREKDFQAAEFLYGKREIHLVPAPRS